MEGVLAADHAVLRWLNSWVGHFPALDAVLKVVVSDYFIPVLFSLVLLGLWFGWKDERMKDRNQRAVFIAMSSLGFANLAVFAINHFYFRPRPFAEYTLNLLFYQPTDSSFPANPVALTFAIATGVYQANPRLGLAMYLLATVFGLTRVYAGVFYPLDIVGGALVGVTIGFLVTLLFRLLHPIPTLALRVARVFHIA
ncbi:MAG: phosphatase PAP2 family protein [Dehalococcoidia bacterium]